MTNFCSINNDFCMLRANKSTSCCFISKTRFLIQLLKNNHQNLGGILNKKADARKHRLQRVGVSGSLSHLVENMITKLPFLKCDYKFVR